MSKPEYARIKEFAEKKKSKSVTIRTHDGREYKATMDKFENDTLILKDIQTNSTVESLLEVSIPCGAISAYY